MRRYRPLSTRTACTRVKPTRICRVRCSRRSCTEQRLWRQRDFQPWADQLLNHHRSHSCRMNPAPSPGQVTRLVTVVRELGLPLLVLVPGGERASIVAVEAVVIAAPGGTRGDIHVLEDPYLSLIHISEPTRLGMISYAVFCL